MELHDTLNPLLWKDFEIKPKILKRIRLISNLWLRFIKLSKKYIKDIIFTGSNANYNYTKFSDIDIHFLIDKSELGCEKFIDEYFLDKKKIFSENYDIKIYDYSVEVYVQDFNEEMTKNQGVFSIKNNKYMSTIIKGIKFYTIPETAEALKVTPQTIRAYIKKGRIKSQRIGRPILITENNLKEFLGVEK